MTTQFGVFAAPKFSFSGVIFAGHENNVVGDVLLGIYCGIRYSQNNKIMHMFLDETKNFQETIIFGCVSINEALQGKAWDDNAKRHVPVMNAIQGGQRVAVQLNSRRATTDKDKCGAGKIMCTYVLQHDSSYQLDQKLIPLIQKALSQQPAAPVAPRKQAPLGFGQFQQPQFQQPTYAPQPQFQAPVQPQVSPQAPVAVADDSDPYPQ